MDRCVTLEELGAEYRELLGRLGDGADSDAELDRMLAEFKGAEGALVDGMEHHLKVLASLEGREAALTAELAAIVKGPTKVLKRLERAQGRYRRYLCNAIIAAGGEAIRTSFGTASVVPADSAIVDDAALLDDSFLVEKAPTADKNAIKAAIRDGETVTGAHVETNYSLKVT